MRILPFVLALGAAGLLAGCEMQGTRRPGDLTQSDLDAGRRIIKADPAMRQVLIHDCRADTRMMPKQKLYNMATIMKVPLTEAPTVLCDRLIGAIESGRLTAEDINAVKRGEISPKVLAIVQNE